EEFFGGFYFDEDALSKDISLDGLDKELEEHKNYDVLISILTNGEKQRDMATMVEGNLGHIEQDLIQVRVCASFSHVTNLLIKLYTQLRHMCVFQSVGY
uniref:Uncharacterized protein n=1 Tax=Aegilops tauschii subsp. strangulata TaxID=200361 RepID=A0A452YHQ9_AEGTS